MATATDKYNVVTTSVVFCLLTLSICHASSGVWTSGGPLGGNIDDLTIHPFLSDTTFVTIDRDVNDPNLLKTTNGGATWEYLPNAPTNLGAIEVDPQNPSVIWAGDGMHRDWDFYIYKTTNGGTSWIEKPVFSFSSASNFSAFSDILIHPEDSNAILVASKNLLSGGSIYGGGVLARSLDGGNNWDFLFGLSTICIAMDSHDYQVVYAGRRRSGEVHKFTNVWGEYVRTEITPAEGIGDVHAIEVDLSSRVYVAASDGLRRWDGTDWTILTGLPTANVTALAIDRSTNPEIVYAGTGGDGVFVSQDAGGTWNSHNEGLDYLSITKLAISETSPKILYAGTAYGGVWSISIVEENDTDADGVSDSLDNCPAVSNADQLDNDADGQGDVCDTDDDNDTVLDTDDNCPLVPNHNQSDVNSNSVGDACDSISDSDGDGLSDAKETQCGSNPTDPSSRCSAGLPWLLLLED